MKQTITIQEVANGYIINNGFGQVHIAHSKSIVLTILKDLLEPKDDTAPIASGPQYVPYNVPAKASGKCMVCGGADHGGLACPYNVVTSANTGNKFTISSGKGNTTESIKGTITTGLADYVPHPTTK